MFYWYYAYTVYLAEPLLWRSLPELPYNTPACLTSMEDCRAPPHQTPCRQSGRRAHGSRAEVRCSWTIGGVWPRLRSERYFWEKKRSHEETPESNEAAAAATGWLPGGSGRRGDRPTTQRAPVRRQRLLQLTNTTLQRGVPADLHRQRVSPSHPVITRDECLQVVFGTGR